MMDKLKVGIIGLGKQSTQDHIPGVLSSESAQLVAVCDIDAKKVGEWSSKLRVDGYETSEQMFSKHKLDFVVIAVPHDQYKPIIEQASKLHVNILKEKPFATSMDEAVYFKNLADGNNIRLMVALQRRFDPIYVEFNRLKDHIGSPFFIEGRQTMIIDDPSEGWRGSKAKAGGGVIIDLGYHMIDMLIWNFGLPNSVHAEMSACGVPEKKYDVEDTATITFDFKDKALHGILILSRCFPRRPNNSGCWGATAA